LVWKRHVVLLDQRQRFGSTLGQVHHCLAAMQAQRCEHSCHVGGISSECAKELTVGAGAHLLHLATHLARSQDHLFVVLLHDNIAMERCMCEPNRRTLRVNQTAEHCMYEPKRRLATRPIRYGIIN